MHLPIDNDMRAVIESAHLCFAATVTADGRPNLSPKGTIRVWDAHLLFFLDIASPRTRCNLAHNPWIELNVVDQTSRRGYRFFGRAMVHQGDALSRAAVARVLAEEGVEYPVDSVIFIAVERAEPLVSPGYAHVADEWAMRRQWRERRTVLDTAFEEHVRGRGAWRSDLERPARHKVREE